MRIDFVFPSTTVSPKTAVLGSAKTRKFTETANYPLALGVRLEARSILPGPAAARRLGSSFELL
jgi:hypothetical protein